MKVVVHLGTGRWCDKLADIVPVMVHLDSLGRRDAPAARTACHLRQKVKARVVGLQPLIEGAKPERMANMRMNHDGEIEQQRCEATDHPRHFAVQM